MFVYDIELKTGEELFKICHLNSMLREREAANFDNFVKKTPF